ncbi:sensor histidine kinase [Portibacter lacus]|uniref:Signal transduction histidine kinase internal region domain-containing protein n=1 Tax=Portibacter lacus TaxID=1099794 RepID=A0AA37SLK5_9BACT|nr:histidine kinase [Portibacter lacus]GLR16352.1 hypothetical protein GCM10007940_09670 [Portibacter lacus]
MRKTLIHIGFCFILVLKLNAQFLQTVNFSKEEVEIYSGIVGMYEEKSRFLWFYGFDGISRYDGSNFEKIEDIYPEAINLPSKNCLSLHRSEDYFWIGTSYQGLYTIDQKGSFSSFQELLNSNQKFEAKSIKKILTYKNYLFVLSEYGLEIFKRDQAKYRKVELASLNSKSINDITIQDELIYAATPTSVQIANLETKHVETFENYNEARFFKDSERKVWVAYLQNGNHISYYEPKLKQFIGPSYQPYKNYKSSRHYVWLENNRLLSFPVNGLFIEIVDFEKEEIQHILESLYELGEERFLRQPFQDSKQRTWLFSKNLHYIINDSPFTPTYLSKNIGSVNDMVVMADKILMSITNKGLYVYHKKTNKLEHFTDNNSKLADDFISSLVDFGKGRIGVCMFNYFQVYNTETGFEEAVEFPGIIRSAVENDNYYCLGGYKNAFKVNKANGVVKKIEIPTFNPNAGNAINAILQKDESNLILGSANLGLINYNLNEDEVDVASILVSVLHDSLKITKINHADISPNKKLIALAMDNGLIIKHLNGKKEKVNTKDHFFTNVVFASDSVLFASARDKILRVSLPSFEIKSFNYKQGLINKNYNLRSSYKDEHGRIFFGGENGIDQIIDEGLELQNTINEILIDQVYFNGVPQFIDPDQKIKIPNDVKILEVKVTTPQASSGGRNTFQARIDQEGAWLNLSGKNRFVLYNPKPGKMNLEFRSVDEYGSVTSKVKELEATIKQKWYENFALLTGLAFLCLAGITLGLFKYQKVKNSRIQEKLILQEELARLELTALNSQMNPHFIFNALSSIKQLITSNETKTAEIYLSKYSKLLRHVIQYSTHQKIKLSEELDFIRNYLDLELLRFSDAFEYQINNKVENPENILIPPFFIQPQLENAIKHGLLNKKEHSLIVIELMEENGMVKIIIEDNGIGREAASKMKIYKNTNTKKGIFLTEERIKNLNKLNFKSSFFMEDLYKNNMANGTRAVLMFEKNKA